LTTQSRRGELVGALGIDVFFALPFTLDFSRLEPADFVHAILVERVKAQAVFVGDNFKFGAKAAGDVDTLRRLGPTLGFSTHGIELLAEDSRPISASVIREHVATGDVRGAARLLGRPHRVDGVVERGDQRGRELGFPTANLRTDKYAAIPADGVYAGSVFQLDERGQTLGRLGTAAISVGTNPTFEGHERRVESFVLDFEGDLYGQGLGVEFVERLRGQEKYDSLADLVLQMDRDVARTRVVLS
jgi:riboflavin kinase/FMN adenylyltransferase